MLHAFLKCLNNPDTAMLTLGSCKCLKPSEGFKKLIKHQTVIHGSRHKAILLPPSHYSDSWIDENSEVAHGSAFINSDRLNIQYRDRFKIIVEAL